MSTSATGSVVSVGKGVSVITGSISFSGIEHAHKLNNKN